MAAQQNPKQTPYIGQFGLMGQRSRETIPMARRALSEETRLDLYDNCYRCGGTGQVDRRQTICNVCGRPWWEDQVEQNPRGFRLVRGTLLPCQHATHHVAYSHPPCPTCGGDKVLPITITLGDLLDFFVSLYPESISQEITAHRAAIRGF